MSSMQQPFNAGQSQGQGQAKAEEWMQSTQETAHEARNATADAAQSAKESAQHGKDQSAGFLQQDNVERQEVDAADCKAVDLSDTESMAAVMGLQFARDLGFSSVMLEMDSKALVQMINDDEDCYETTSWSN
ncbi:late embryogenesis abundant protein 1-like [Pyrus ussuriensis x Pyrus communis]|uniref:Late embryogenesis abundant protein 1-like n=1 Tax=Pyrus ussuriensis x Pyrus communis TaxID=2448454 RepID=A0A5N5HCN0_9ROSA|nr:late embryogenesis abundant protein 1-like [Pyrus ussuriensis x Pyrus communis]